MDDDLINPLTFFENLLDEDGLYNLLQSFKQVSEYEENFGYDHDNNIKIYQFQNQGTGEWEIHEFSFEFFLNDLLLKEYLTATKKIDSSILAFSDKAGRDTYISSIISIIQYLELQLVKNNNKSLKIKDYPKIKSCLDKLYDKYIHFLPKNISPSINSDFIWNRSQTDLLRLTAALWKIKAIKKNTEDIQLIELTKIMSELFNVPFGNEKSLLSHAKDNKKESDFFDKLNKAWEDYVNGSVTDKNVKK